MSRDVPFGKPFAYTDATELPTQLDHRPWYKRWWPKKKPPLGWAVIDAGTVPQAYVASSGEVRTSPIEVAGAIVPVYDDNVILGADAYEQANPQPKGP